MADDIQIFVKVVGQKDIISTTNSLNKMESGVKRLSKDLSKGRISGDQYSTGLKELRRGVDSLFPSWQKAKTAVDQYSKGLIKATADQTKAKAAMEADKQATKAYTQARREATQEDQRRTAILKDNKDALNAQRVATEANTAQVHRYRMASDAVYATEQKLLQLKKTLRTEVANDNMTMREAAAVQMKYKQSLNQVNAGLQQGRNRMSSMGVVTQQAGYQIGDFIVQVQGGQSALVAFSQQATQMVGFLPLMASRLGITAAAAVGLSAALGIGIPIVASLGMILLATRSAAEDGAKGIKTYADAAKDAHKEIREARLETEALNKGFRDSGELTLQKGLEKAKKDLEDAIKARDDLLAPKDTKEVVRPEGYDNILGGSRSRIQGTQMQINAEIASRVIANERAAEAVEFAEKEVSAKENLIRLLLEQRATQEALTRGMEDRKSMLESEKALLEERDRVVKSIIKDRDAELKSLKDGTELAKVALEYGKDSAEFKALEAEQSRKKYLEEQKAQGVLGNNLKILMDSYDENVKITDEMYNLVDAATELGTRLGMAFSDAINLIRQAKAEAMVGLDVFGGAGEFKYSTPSVFNKIKKPAGGGGGGGKSQADELSEYLQKKQEEARLQEQLLGLFGTEREIQSELLKAREDYFGVLTPLQEKELENTLRQTAATKEQQAVLEEAKAQQEGLAQSIANSMGDAFMSVIDGTASVKDAFKSMAAAIIKELLQVLVIQRLVGSVGGGGTAGTGLAGWLSKTLPSANGNVFSGGSHVQAYANGGVVGGPTYFPMSGGKTGLMGEAGPEAIMPLKRGANGKLGVQMEGGGGDNVVINQSFNFQANGDDSVKKLIAQAAPKIAQMTKSSMLDDRRRGGQTKSVFG